MARNPNDQDIPTRVFERFVEKLTASSVPPAIVTRIRAVVLDKEELTEADLESAILLDDPLS